MIELSKHIECLLLRHNCVIVPGLGGFVTQYVPARYVAEEELFFPPFRSVGFNPRLTLNDGLLVQSYMQAYDTSYPETQHIVENAVAEVRAELQERGSFTFNGIGTLSLDAAGNYDFVPCEAGVLSLRAQLLYSQGVGRSCRIEERGEGASQAQDARGEKE